MSARLMSMSDGSARPSSKLGDPIRSRPSGASDIVSIRPSVLVLFTSAAATVGLVAGITLARPVGGHTSHAEGACIAMDLATAYGFLDETKRKVVTRALSQANNPYAGNFPAGYRALTATCARVESNRWGER